MANEINLTSQRWNDIVFEGKNKEYGAYEMRKSSSKRHVVALMVILTFVVFVSFLPTLIETLTPERAADNLTGETVLAAIRELEEQVKEKDIIREVAAPPAPILKATIQFTVPDMVTKAEITDDNSLASQDDLLQSTAQVSVATVLGEKEGVDIQDLEGHKVVAEAKTDEIFTFVEVSAKLPGDDEKMTKARKYIQDNLNLNGMNAGISGKMVVQFVVNIDGSITDIQFLSSPDSRLSREVERVMKSMPKWIPGRNNGQAVRVRHILPINFNAGD